MTIRQKLSQPYPLHSFNEGMKRNLFFSVFLALFLLVFRPFGLEVYPYEESYIIAGYGLVTFLTVLLCDYVSTYHLRNIFNEETWTVIKQVVYAIVVLFLLGITNYIYAFLIGAFPGTLSGFLKVQLYVLLSCIVPVTIMVLWRQNHLLKKNLLEASRLTSELQVHSRQLSNTTEDKFEGKSITFTGTNKNESVSVPAHELICLISKENYVEVAWLNNGKTEKTLLRSTLSNAEQSITAFPNFFRSHRACIVNLKKVKTVQGNAQGYRLTVEGIEGTIPVARGRGPALHEMLNAVK